MKTKIYFISCILTLISVYSCDKSSDNTEISSSGYLEYQYDYKVVTNGVESTRQGYKRVNITDVAFATYDANTLDSVYIKKGFRKVELYMYSKECNPDSLNQPLGASFAQASLIDSLGLDSNPNRVLDFPYPISSLASLATTNRPLCSALSVNMNMMTDTVTHTNKYEYSYVGQVGKKLNIFYFGGDKYQIIANGSANSKIYTIYYFGTIRRKKNISSN